MCRLAVEAWGLKNCTQKEEWFSDTVTAVVVPPYIDSSEIVKTAWKRYNLSLGLGLNKVAGKVFRIGHLGNLNEVGIPLFLLSIYLSIVLLSPKNTPHFNCYIECCVLGAVATTRVSCWGGNGTEGCWLSSQVW